MQQLKSAKVAILKRCQFGTFELLHGFLKNFWLNNFIFGLKKKTLNNFVQTKTKQNP